MPFNCVKREVGRGVLVSALVLFQTLGIAAPEGVTPTPAPVIGTDLFNKLPFSLSVGGVTDQIGQATDLVANTASDLLISAMGFLGVPYKRGGTSAETGFDCSGFVAALYKQSLGLVLPRTAKEQAAVTQNIDARDLQPGDLVFFNTMRRAFSHVGIYMGDGKFIHSPRAGGQVRVEDMSTQYWKTRFNGARRVNATEQQP